VFSAVGGRDAWLGGDGVVGSDGGRVGEETVWKGVKGWRGVKGWWGVRR
jgi:hypothetical protein